MVRRNRSTSSSAVKRPDDGFADYPAELRNLLMHLALTGLFRLKRPARGAMPRKIAGTKGGLIQEQQQPGTTTLRRGLRRAGCFPRYPRGRKRRQCGWNRRDGCPRIAWPVPARDRRRCWSPAG